MHFLRLSRRSILKGMGASAALLPFAARGGGDEPPSEVRRLVVMYSPNGVHPSWGASGQGADMQLSPSLEPLTDHRDRICVVGGIAMRSVDAGEHPDGTIASLTGRETIVPGEQVSDGISIDQVIADTNTPSGGYRSLNLYAMPQGFEVPRISFTKGGGNVALQSDPAQAFADVFNGFVPPDQSPMPAGPDPAEERRLFLRRSVVDAANQDFGRVRNQLGSADRALIERHIEALDALAMRLHGEGGGMPMPSALCDPMAPPGTNDSIADEEVAARGRAFSQVLAMAMACDRTRVGTLVMGPSSGGLGEHHAISHSIDYEPAIGYDQFYAARFAELVDAFQEVGLLEGTLIVWLNELGKFAIVDDENFPEPVADHGLDDMPYVFAGGLADTGRAIQIDGSPNHNYLLAGILQTFGIDSSFFGDENYTQPGQSPIVAPFTA